MYGFVSNVKKKENSREKNKTMFSESNRNDYFKNK